MVVAMMKKNSHHMPGALKNQLTKLSKKTTVSNSPFEEYLKYNTLLEKKSKQPDYQNYTKSRVKNTLEMSSELRKYE